jgi:hypothetical protein
MATNAATLKAPVAVMGGEVCVCGGGGGGGGPGAW